MSLLNFFHQMQNYVIFIDCFHYPQTRKDMNLTGTQISALLFPFLEFKSFPIHSYNAENQTFVCLIR